MGYTIIQRFISMNRSGKTLDAIGTVVHETATPGASDENEYNYFNSGYRGASAHAFVDYDSITQTIPWTEQAWHAGPTANKSYIGIELCNYSDPAKFNEIWNRAVWLFAYVHVKVINVTTINKTTLMSHAEVSNTWGETDHMDPIAYFAKFGKTVDDFRAAVQAEINSMISNPSYPYSNISYLQTVLNRLKITDYEGKALVVDGIVGPRTTSAIKNLQGICGLPQTGIVGPETSDALNLVLSKPLLSTGSRGYAVRYVQFRVGVSIDGIFGPKTKAGVMRYQSQNGLAADGIVGPKTWGKLIG